MRTKTVGADVRESRNQLWGHITVATSVKTCCCHRFDCWVRTDSLEGEKPRHHNVRVDDSSKTTCFIASSRLWEDIGRPWLALNCVQQRIVVVGEVLVACFQLFWWLFASFSILSFRGATFDLCWVNIEIAWRMYSIRKIFGFNAFEPVKELI